MNTNLKEKNNRFLRLPQVLELIPVGKATIYQLMQKGKFPKQVKLGSKLSVWRKSDIEAYISNGGCHE